MNNRGLYIHIPFCVRKCVYCDFTSFAGRLSCADDYIGAVLDEARKYPYTYDSVYIGGGTPSLLTGAQASRLLGGVDIAPNAEVSMECNPGTADVHTLAEYRNAGVNRLSVGVQSLDDGLLKFLGRIHTSREARSILTAAKSAGFTNISADMMTGLPHQTVQTVRDTVRGLIDAGVTHLSCYSLQVEEGTPLYAMQADYPDEDTERELFYAAAHELQAAGFARYETSNFALPGFECRHNLKYWTGAPYIGLGVAAHSLENGVRWCNTRDIDAYLSGDTRREETPLTEKDVRFEFIMLRLRLASGLRFAEWNAEFCGDFEREFADGLNQAVSAGLVTRDALGVYPTERGFDLQNALIGIFVNKL